MMVVVGECAGDHSGSKWETSGSVDARDVLFLRANAEVDLKGDTEGSVPKMEW